MIGFAAMMLMCFFVAWLLLRARNWVERKEWKPGTKGAVLSLLGLLLILGAFVVSIPLITPLCEELVTKGVQ